MFRPTFRAWGLIAPLLGLSVASTGCDRSNRLPPEPSSQAAPRDTAQDSATVLALDRKYWEAEKSKGLVLGLRFRSSQLLRGRERLRN
jgi:hypothetical protein